MKNKVYLFDYFIMLLLNQYYEIKTTFFNGDFFCDIIPNDITNFYH